ncbi:hypothetical protein BLJ79_04960 [Arthrobacter sp. UCD-GKA]|uniref:hypothetical protein n=1 Tax=Arthrobacter sp. UCD-GKA TaxID=1913576 RepID=UPI0008DE0BBA|nr:hypothetical protein [Arthrobacter sp. UCD-GKA]OIH86138.1 hypothetical protein BLJ79_04960 [Arthrobacter sp. UCD-GKA]
MDLSFILWTSFMAAAVVSGRMRWKYVTRRRLTDEYCSEIAETLAAEIFSLSAGPATPVPIGPDLRKAIGSLELIEVVRWMNGRGYTKTKDWGYIQILLGEPPTTIAITQREYDKAIASPQIMNVIHGPGNINNGGVQIVAGGDTIFNGDFLLELAAAVRNDARDVEGTEHDEAMAIAHTLESAGRGDIDQDLPRFQRAMMWLKERTGEVAVGAMGSGLWAGATALFAKLGA